MQVVECQSLLTVTTCKTGIFYASGKVHGDRLAIEMAADRDSNDVWKLQMETGGVWYADAFSEDQ